MTSLATTLQPITFTSTLITNSLASDPLFDSVFTGSTSPANAIPLITPSLVFNPSDTQIVSYTTGTSQVFKIDPVFCNIQSCSLSYTAMALPSYCSFDPTTMELTVNTADVTQAGTH